MDSDYKDLSIQAVIESGLPIHSIERLLNSIYSLPSVVHRNEMDITDFENVKDEIQKEREGAAGV